MGGKKQQINYKFIPTSLFRDCSLIRGFFIVIYITASSKWPAGTYGLPRAQSGCPSSNQFTWRTGWRYQDTEDIFPSNARSSNFHLDASVDKNNLKRSFCIKTDTSANTSRTIWPKGRWAPEGVPNLQRLEITIFEKMACKSICAPVSGYSKIFIISLLELTESSPVNRESESFHITRNELLLGRHDSHSNGYAG